MLPLHQRRVFEAEAAGLEPANARCANCFQDSILIQPDDFRYQSGNGSPRCSSNQDSDCSMRFGHLSSPSGNCTQSASFKGSRRGYAPERVPYGNRTRLAGLEDRSLCRSAKGTESEAEGEGTNASRRCPNPQGR